MKAAVCVLEGRMQQWYAGWSVDYHHYYYYYSKTLLLLLLDTSTSDERREG